MGHVIARDAQVVVTSTAKSSDTTKGGRSFSASGYAVHLLVALFGISSWVSVNGIFVELPLLVQKLPEGWNLPSYLAVVVQLANVGPIVYGLLHRYFPRKINETSATFVMMTVGTLACCALIFLWSRTTYIGGGASDNDASDGDDAKSGSLHSVHLLVLVFFVSLVDCTSSVVFLPFMRFFKETFLVTLFVGEGFSSLLPGLVAIAQGINADPKCVNVTLNETIAVAPEPNFGVESFFGFLTTMMSISFVAFVLLRYLPSLDSERLQVMCPSAPVADDHHHSPDATRMENAIIFNGRRFSNYGTDGSSRSDDVVVHDSNSTTMLATSKHADQFRMSTSKSSCLFALQTWICVLSNGVLPSISSFYCLPYGNAAYHFSASLSSVANPLACFVAAFFAVRKTVALAAFTLLGTLFAVYLIVIAALSPAPPLVGTRTGEVLVVLVSICMTATFSFTKVSLASSFRARGGVRSLFWCGVATQTGSAVGSLVMFIIVNHLKVFHSVQRSVCT